MGTKHINKGTTTLRLTFKGTDNRCRTVTGHRLGCAQAKRYARTLGVEAPYRTRERAVQPGTRSPGTAGSVQTG